MKSFPFSATIRRPTGARGLFLLAAAALFSALSVPAYEEKALWTEVQFADGPFDFTGASSAASTIMVFLPSFHCTEAFLNMLGENGVDRLDEIELACRENPKGLIADLPLPGVDAVVRAVRRAFARQRGSKTAAGPGPRRRTGELVLRTNADLLRALAALGRLRLEDLPPPAQAGRKA